MEKLGHKVIEGVVDAEPGSWVDVRQCEPE